MTEELRNLPLKDLEEGRERSTEFTHIGIGVTLAGAVGIITSIAVSRMLEKLSHGNKFGEIVAKTMEAVGVISCSAVVAGGAYIGAIGAMDHIEISGIIRDRKNDENNLRSISNG